MLLLFCMNMNVCTPAGRTRHAEGRGCSSAACAQHAAPATPVGLCMGICELLPPPCCGAPKSTADMLQSPM